MLNRFTQIFIPRIDSSLSDEFICQTFRRLDIGEITNIHKRSKFDNPYCFAFISLNLFSTFMGDKLRSNLECKKSTRIYYDSDQVMCYWEIKPYIETNSRFTQSQYNKNMFDIANLCAELTRVPIINKENEENDENEFGELAKDIENERQYYYDMWNPSVFGLY